MKFRCIENLSFTKYLVIFIAIILVNTLFLANPVNCLFTIIQYFIVLFFVVKNNLDKAVLWHFLFIMLSFSSQGVTAMFEGDSFSLYDYGSIKLIGPIRISYIINILLLLLLSKRKPNKEILFYKLYKILSFIMISGVIIGMIGCFFNKNYSFEAFINNGVYVFVVFTSMFILLRVFNKHFTYLVFHLGLCAIMASVIVSFISFYVFGTKSSYSVYDMPVSAVSAYFAPLLIIGIPFIKQKIYVFISIILMFLSGMNVISGKGIFVYAFCLMCLLYFVLVDSYTKTLLGKHYGFIRLFIISLIPFMAVLISHILLSNSMTSFKLNSALSIFSGDLDSISASPYIRIASLINIIYEGFINPFTLLFGNGYGGYFRDGMTLFEGLDLSNGAWGDADIQSGNFHSGHDTMITIPLFNGLVGLYLICKIGILYIKRIKYNFLNAVIFLWLFMVFYYNTLFAYIGLFLLIGAEYNYHQDKSIIYKEEDC